MRKFIFKKYAPLTDLNRGLFRMFVTEKAVQAIKTGSKNEKTIINSG